MYIKTLIFSLLITCSVYSQVSSIKIDDVGDGWKHQVEEAIELIQQTDDLRYSLLLKNCNHITFGVNGYSTTSDSTIIIDKGVFDLNSKNNLACTIVHESKHLEIKSWNVKMTEKKQEYFAYLTEYAFFSKLKNGEEWLKDFLVSMMIENQ
jgi:hypothetical protein